MKCDNAKPENYLIRVNRQPAAREHVLVDGSRVSFTPTKIEGAKCPAAAYSARLFRARSLAGRAARNV